VIHGCTRHAGPPRQFHADMTDLLAHRARDCEGRTLRGPHPAGFVLRVQVRDAPQLRKALATLGMRVASTSEFGRVATVPAHLDGADALFFERFGLALVREAPDRRGVLAREAARHPLLRAWRPECRYRVYGKSRAAGAAARARAAWALRAVGAHLSRLSGAGIRVALLDSGLDVGHPDFAGRSVRRELFAAGSDVDDVLGHGTSCAGIACGPLRPKDVPRYGVAHESEIYAGKVIGDDGCATDLSLMAGLHWALDHRCEVVCIPLGTPQPVSERVRRDFERIAASCLHAGTLVIAAAGNGSRRPRYVEPVNAPASAAGVVAVGALDRALRPARTSAGGDPEHDVIDISAPGVGVLSAQAGGGHELLDGTSAAAALVSGVAALLAQSNSNLRGVALRTQLLRLRRACGDPAAAPGWGLAQVPRG